MTSPTPDQPQTGQTPAPADQTQWQRLLDRMPLRLALLAIGLVWLAGCVWSFEEQTKFATSKGFQTPKLLPLVIDGMAIAMAAVAYAASLDARPAVFARLGTALAVACSAASNAAWAWARSNGDEQTIALAVGVPVVANLAFEVLLAESRRQVLRRRGQPGPVAVPYPRLVRMVLAPWSTFRTWRNLVLEATDPRAAFAQRRTADPQPTQATTPDPVREVEQTTPLPQRQTPRALPADRRTTAASVRLVRSGDDDAALTKLRQWQTANGGQTPSLSQIQQTVGGGRSRAIRLRGLLPQSTTDDTDRVAV